MTAEVIGIISRHTDAVVTEDKVIWDDLGIGSFGMMLIIDEVWNELGYRIDYTDLKGVRTVGDFIAALKSDKPRSPSGET